MSNFKESFESAFKDQDTKFNLFCTDNLVFTWHSGGGLFHYAYQDKEEKIMWLINHVDYDEEDGKSVPTKLDDEVICSLDLNNIVDETTNFEAYTKIISELEVDGVVFENKYTPLLMIHNKTFEQAVDLIKKATDEIIKRTKT